MLFVILLIAVYKELLKQHNEQAVAHQAALSGYRDEADSKHRAIHDLERQVSEALSSSTQHQQLLDQHTKHSVHISESLEHTVGKLREREQQAGAVCWEVAQRLRGAASDIDDLDT